MARPVTLKPEERRRQHLGLRINHIERERLYAIAEREGVTTSDLLREALDTVLAKRTP